MGDRRGVDRPPPGSGQDTDEERALAVEGHWVAYHGAAPTLDHYRAVYRRQGVEWPGDDAIRRRHFISDDGVISAPTDAGPSSAA